MQMGPGTYYTLRHNATSINKDLIFDLVLPLDLYFNFIHSTVVIFFGDISIGISWEGPLWVTGQWFEINA